MKRSEMLNLLDKAFIELLHQTGADKYCSPESCAELALTVCERHMTPPTYHKPPSDNEKAYYVFRNGRWLQQWEHEDEAK